jgi:hypothetical protein
MASYESGQIYTETIDRVSRTGNGIIDVSATEPDHINIGEIDESQVGEMVTFRYEGACHAKLVSKNPIGSNSVDNKNDLLSGHM